ncbi:MAG TPA: response regulator [Sulfuricurvum sp.]|nr:response regulator [Sulfuricurvum sp.]
MTYNILIVEDSKLISDNLKKSLELDGHYLEQAYDLETAITLTQSHRFDYILLDLILPDGEGEMLLPYAKRADARVIIMTTDRDSFRRDRLFGFGIVDYITKERYFDDIVESIRNTIKQVESNTEYTILVVDDSSFIRNNLELLLSSRGFLILTAANGKEAVQIIEKYPIDALVADLEMPLMDGFSLMAMLRRKKEYKNLPVMILTGSNDSNKIAKVIKHGVKDLIRKPYIIEEVLLKIDNMINEVKQNRIIGEGRRKFDLYHDAIENSTLYLKLSPDLEVVYINDRLSHLLFGHGGDAFEPVYLKDLMKNPTLELFRAFQKFSPQSPPITTVLLFENHHAEACYISATFSGIFDDRGTVREFVAIGHDITQIQRHEQHLEHQIKEQIHINSEQQQLMFNQAKMAAMGEMIGNIAHQWRQPLNTLGLVIQNLEDAHAYGEMNDAFISDVTEKSMAQITFMSKTIDDFRNFFQPNKRKERFDMAEAVTSTLDIIAKTLENHHIRLLFEDAAPGRYLVYGYRNELQQVILNLLKNADDVLYAQADSGEKGDKWIRITIGQEGERIRLGIEDSGGGIPESVIDRIFEPYFTTKEEGKGTGIGLYMSKMIIEQNIGGSLNASNTPAGAHFSIVIPMDQSAGEAS